jgi:hypothetical protein
MDRLNHTRRAAVALPLLAAGAYYAVFVARSSFSFEGRTYFALFDDAMISMRYGRNFADGSGLVWTPGEHVEGYSNFLWTLWMAVIHLTGLPDRLTSLAVMVSGAALLVATLLVVRRLCALIVPEAPLVGLLAIVMTALYYPLVFWALRGMEVSLAAFLVALAALLAVTLSREWSARRCWWLAAVLGAAVLTRDDLLVPSLVVIAWLAWQLPRERRRRTLLIVGGAVVAVIAGHEIVRLAYYGEALPNTYYLKLGGISLGDRLLTGGESLVYTALYSLSAPLLLAGAAVAVRRRSAPVLLLAALFAALSAYSVYTGGDAWEDVRFANRYFATVAPLLMVLAAVGIHVLAGRVRSVAIAFGAAALLLLGLYAIDSVPHARLGITGDRATQFAPALLLLGCAVAIVVKRRAPAAVGIAVALLAVAATSADPTASWVRSNAQDVPLEEVWTKTGVELRRHTDPGTSIAFVVAGNMAYFADRPAIDLLGKMDPAIARRQPTELVPLRFRPGHNKWDYDHSVGRLRPTVVASLWLPTQRDICNLERWGYEQVAPGAYVQRGAPGVDAPALGVALRPLSFGPRYRCPA